MRNILLLLLPLLMTVAARSQVTCSALGQNPGTAFPVCGVDTFSMADVPICGDRVVPGPCNNVPLTDKNPFWYRFTCFKAGTLAFEIVPNTISDDYDWQIFDITGRDPNSVYTDPSLFVACNWSGEGGLTGASAAGNSLIRCDGLGVDRFSSMPTLLQGHTYLLLVSHFSNSQSGYSLSFGGGTASITDPIEPKLAGARAACDGTKINVKLNKLMKCSSLAADGSDFSITPAIGNIIGAVGVNCDNGFDMDSLVITIDRPLPPGDYTVRIETGTDENNLLDNCNNGIPAGQTLPVTVYPLVATPMDSITTPGCAPAELELVFSDPMLCNSIAANGSDFLLDGPPGISVTGASGVCSSDGLTYAIRVTLSAPVERGGAYRLQLRNGTDGNTIINECGVPTLAGAVVVFNTVDTVSADFAVSIQPGCTSDNVHFSHNAAHGVNSWAWTFNGTINSTRQDTTINYTTFGNRQAMLAVSNGICQDSATVDFDLNTHISAAFETVETVCPGDPVKFRDMSTGPVTAWSWTFGNGQTSQQQEPAEQLYPYTNINTNYTLSLIIRNALGCSDTATKRVLAVGNCFIAVPKGFSPNNDGLNDYLYPTNAYKAKDLKFRVYNRGGQLVFETTDWHNKWDGSFHGNPQDPGTYVWTLTYTHIETNRRYDLRGSTVLLR